MPTSQPVRASGSLEMRRPKPIPGKVKEACLAMIYGRPDDAEAGPLDFVQAAKVAGIRPNILRKWLHKPTVVAFIRRERSAFRTAICAANEFALRKVRDESANGMSVVASVRALQDLDETEVAHSRGTQQTPGIVIVISPPRENIAPEPVTVIDATPLPKPERFDADGYRTDEHGRPVFDPARPHR
ncbi:MAG: hypothetical protein WAK67_22915 [Xanthobacteraceae bacterium]